MRRIVLAAACVGAALTAAVPGISVGHATPATVPLTHAGQWLVDASGRVVELHGLNMVAKQPPYEPSQVGFDDDDAAFLAAHGFNVVRLGVILEALEPTPGQFDAAYLDSIVRTARILADHGVQVLVDFHQDMYNERFQGEGLPDWMVQDDGLPAQPTAGFPGNYFAMPALNRAFDHFWADDAGPGGIGLQERYAQAWEQVARQFADAPGVLGYDLLNEPWPGSAWPTCLPPVGCPLFDQQSLGPFTTKTISAIRTVDQAHLTFYEPALMFDFSAPTYLGKVGDAQSGMGFHAYCLAAVGAPETPPTRSMCDYVESTTVSNAESRSAKTGDALLLTEFGATTDTAELRSVIDLADQHGVPWIEWAYCGCGDPTGSGSAEALVDKPALPPTGSNVNMTTLRALDEPYPTATAGTPHGYHFDPTTRLFTYSFSTTRAGGGSFAADVTTDIYVPELQYPHGYAVDVTGARVVSAPGARTLRLRALHGTGTVTLKISPVAAP